MCSLTDLKDDESLTSRIRVAGSACEIVYGAHPRVVKHDLAGTLSEARQSARESRRVVPRDRRNGISLRAARNCVT